MERRRIEWIDVVKGIGIILVVFGHSNVPHAVDKLILSFHMPVFFFISGFLFYTKKGDNLLSFAKNKFQKLIIPYFLFAFITYCFWVLIERKIQTVDVNVYKPLVGMFYSVNEDNYMIFDGVLWFIPCLFIVEILFYIIHKINKSHSGIAISLVILSILGYFSTFLPIRLIWNVDVAFTAIMFYGIGFLLKTQIQKAELYSYKMKIILITIGIIVNMIFTNTNDIVYMYLNQYGNFVYFYLAALGGILSLALIAMMIKKSKILSYLGKNTFIILALHIKVITALSYTIRHIFNLPNDIFTDSLLWGIIFTILTLLILVPFIHLINNYFPFLLGRSNRLKKFSQRFDS